MKNLTPFLIGSILLTLVACQKEQSVDTLNGAPGTGGSTGGGNSTAGKSEIGTWKVLSMRGITSSTVEYSLSGDAIKSVTLSDYTTDNNGGTVKFDGSTITGTGVTYSADFVADNHSYLNGAPFDSAQVPYSFVIPPTNSTASYKKIKSDSIYVQAGAFAIGGSSGTTPSNAGGYKLAWSGDQMTLTAAVDQSQIQLVQGVSARITAHAVQILTLQKQ